MRSAVRSGEFLAGEFDGVGQVVSWIDYLEANFGADGPADELGASVRGLADGGLVVDFLNEKTIAEAGIEGGSFWEDFGDLEQLSFLIDAKGSADASDFEDHVSKTFFPEGKSLKDGPADAGRMAVSLVCENDNTTALQFVEADKRGRTQRAAAVAEKFGARRIIDILVDPGHGRLSEIG